MFSVVFTLPPEEVETIRNNPALAVAPSVRRKKCLSVKSVQTKGLTVLLTEEGGGWAGLGLGGQVGMVGFVRRGWARGRGSSDPDCRVEVLVGITVVNAG